LNTTLAISLVSVWVASTGLLFSMLVFIQGRINALDEKLSGSISKLADKEALDIGAVRTEFGKDIERIQALERDARHRLANDTSKTIAEVQIDLRRIRDDSATKGELDALERRLVISMSKIEARVDRVDAKLEALPAMQAILAQMSLTIERISDTITQRRKDADA
jgi:hypothetical protein